MSDPLYNHQQREVRIVEEVPGVPEDESYYVWTGIYPIPPDQHFRTAAAAKAWCEARGLTYTVEPFEP